MSPAEIFSTQENLFSHNYGEYLICDQVAYEAFKKEQLTEVFMMVSIKSLIMKMIT